MSIQGRVRSQAAAGALEPLPGADIELVCPEARERLAKTSTDGAFSYTAIGHWPERCAVEASTFDGSHLRLARSISELCDASSDATCYRITNAQFTLTRLNEGRRMSRVVFRPDDERLELVRSLGTGEDVLCSGACEAEMHAGPQRISVRLRNTARELWSEEVTLARDRSLRVHFIEDTDPVWPSTLGLVAAAAGTGLLLYGGQTKRTAPFVAGASTLAAGLTVMLVWAEGMHSAEVHWNGP